MAFIDEAKISVESGAGGDGASAFLHEPYKPNGGPDGGDGGDGGDVILRTDPSVGTLLDLRDHPHVKAERGVHGSGKRKHGARGRDRVVLVPPGTMVYDEDGTLLADLPGHGDEVVLVSGGKGGRGNARFATATRRAPSFAEKGEPGTQQWLKLELRALADVGLVGFPNAGKSTLIARISAARPKIADYPFTTLEPNLGVVRVGETSFVVADIPGLVPGAHTGKGLGHRFLRHISRAAVLVYLVDSTAQDRDPAHDVAALRLELERFDPSLLARPSIVVVNKADALPELAAELASNESGSQVISAVTGLGVERLLNDLAIEVTRGRSTTPTTTSYVRHVVLPDRIRVEREEGAWRVTGRRAERLVVTTNLDNEEAVARLQRRLIKIGVEKALHEAGAVTGDEVRIGDTAFDFQPDRDDEDVTA